MKTVKLLDGPEADAAREVIETCLNAAVGTGMQHLGCSPGSFVTAAMSMWTAELAQIDGEATADMLRALATLSDPCSGEGDRQAAELARQDALRRIMQSIELMVCDAQGSA